MSQSRSGRPRRPAAKSGRAPGKIHTAPVEVRIERIAYGGAGVGRSGGLVVFVPFTVPGESVVASPRRLQKRFCEAELIRVETPSPMRQRPVCAYFERCGGCSYQHVPYATQLEWKTIQVKELLERLGGIQAPPVAPTIPSPLPLGYRNRIRVHAENQGGLPRIGFYAKRGRHIIDVPSCPIASAEVNAKLAALRRSNPPPGEYTLSERPEVRFFEQTNDGAAAELVRLVSALASSGQALLVDAYCGAGFFGHLLSRDFERVIGIESHPEAVGAARGKAAPNESYVCGDVAFHLPQILADVDPLRTTVLLDPPAAGLSARVTELLGKALVRSIVYVSCDPATLARDLGMLVGFGYRLDTVVPVDMFPQTADIEVVAALSHEG